MKKLYVVTADTQWCGTENHYLVEGIEYTREFDDEVACIEYDNLCAYVEDEWEEYSENEEQEDSRSVTSSEVELFKYSEHKDYFQEYELEPFKEKYKEQFNE